MRRLLTDYNCDPNVLDFYGEQPLISYCVCNHKDESFKMMVTLCKDKLLLNKYGRSQLGLFIQSIDCATWDLLHFVYKEMPNALDVHNPCMEFYGQFVVPIYRFILQFEIQDYDELIQNEDFIKWFTDSKFIICTKVEVDSLILLSQDERFEKLCHEFLQRHIEDESLKKYYQKQKDVKLKVDQVFKNINEVRKAYLNSLD